MRSLAQPRVLGRAILAALLTSLACYPRLAGWSGRSAPVELMWLVLLWVMFVLWGFVFAWQFQYARRPVLKPDGFQPKLWGLASLGALAAALLAHFILDPKLRPLMPALYPTDWSSWPAMALWTVAFDPLFLCFAPFAFFIRLSRRQEAALAMTVVFDLFVMALKISSLHALFSTWLLAALTALCALAGFALLYLYLALLKSFRDLAG
jgi:hypothetical protein